MTKVTDTIKQLFGVGAIRRLGDAPEPIPVISTGLSTLDEALGVGGLPRGYVTELFGSGSGSGTTDPLTEIALHLLAAAQRAGGTCAFIDAEHTLDVGYARRLGVSLDDLLVSQPDCGEQGFEIADTLARTGAIDLIIVASVDALTPRAEIAGELNEYSQARLMSQAIRRLAAVASVTRTVVVFVNRHRGCGGMANALKFYSSVRLSVGPVGDGKVKVKIVKNKVAPPFREAEFEVQPRTESSCNKFTGPSGKCSTCYWLAVEHAGTVPSPKSRGCVGWNQPTGVSDLCAFCCLPFKWHEK